MKALISDIHANLAALKSALDRIDVLGVDQILCLGDIAGYHVEINECIDLLREREILCIKGNHDHHLVTGTKILGSNSANDVLNFQRSIITKENLVWLSSLATRFQFQDLTIVHGGWENELNEYIYIPENHRFPVNNIKFYASGHTHIPIIKKVGEITYCNPGSIGQPRDGNQDSSFALFDGKQFYIMRNSYDIKKTQCRMKEAGFSSYYYENLERGLRIGS